MRCLYLDMDGTLLGPGGGLLARARGGSVSLLGVRAIEACLRADVEVVVMSGRRRIVAMEDARLLGQRACIFETGAGIVLDERDALADRRLGCPARRRSTSRSRPPARPRCCSSTTPGGSRSTRPGTRGARSRTCCAASSTPTRPTRCWRARPRHAAPDRQRRRAPPLAGARRPARGARLPPATRGRSRRPLPSPCTSACAASSPRDCVGGRRLARGPRGRGRRRRVLARRQRARARPGHRPARRGARQRARRGGLARRRRLRGRRDDARRAGRWRERRRPECSTRAARRSSPERAAASARPPRARSMPRGRASRCWRATRARLERRGRAGERPGRAGGRPRRSPGAPGRLAQEALDALGPSTCSSTTPLPRRGCPRRR